MWSFSQHRSPHTEAPPPTEPIMGTPTFSMPIPTVPNSGLPPQPFQPLGLPSPPTDPSRTPHSHRQSSYPPPSSVAPASPSSLPAAPGTNPSAFPGGFGVRDVRPLSSTFEPERHSTTRLQRLPPTQEPAAPRAHSRRPVQHTSQQDLRRPQEARRPVKTHASQANLRPSAEAHRPRPHPPPQQQQQQPAVQVAQNRPEEESKTHRIAAFLGHKIASTSAPHLPLSVPGQQTGGKTSAGPARPAGGHVRMSAEDDRFVYSACTGRKKALCIGINYTGSSRELYGCVNDARNVRKWLIKHKGFKQEDIVLLIDGPASKERSLPTRSHILAGMRWLVRDAKQNDSLFFHYSGHGAQARDKDGDEPDGYDEVIFPLDYKKAGYIVDDDMHAIMVRPLPPGCRLTSLFDSCHSGSALDLPFLYQSDGRVKGLQVTDQALDSRKSCADVISFAACKDSQTSADTYENGEAVGAMSYAFMLALSQNPTHTYQGLLKAVRKILNDKYSQKPQLSASHRIDTNLKFVL